MYHVEDQDEDVEEEEEFHEVEEEKHKTSQESVGTTGKLKQLEEQSISPSNESPSLQSDEQKGQLPEKQNIVADTTPTENSIHAAEQVCVKIGSPKPSNSITEPAESRFTSEILSKVEKIEPEHGDSNTSQVSNESNCSEAKTTQPASEPKAVIDWANIMMTSSDPSAEASSSKKEAPDTAEQPQQADTTIAEDTIDSIVEDTQGVLKIVDGSNSGQESSTKQPDDHEDPVQTQTSAPTSAVSKDEDQVPQEVASSEPAIDATGSANVAKAEEDKDEAKESEDKELDLDEDVKNPQYIPKKGVFYEHDDRSHDTDEKKSSPPTTKKDSENIDVKDTGANKKASGSEKPADNRRSNRRQRTDADRWGHDLFRNEKQKPKSKSELIDAYGYDIRQERGSRNTSLRTGNNNNNNNNSNTNNNNNNSNNSNIDRVSANQEGQRSRQPRDARGPRQILPSTNNGSRERKPRRQNTKNNRGDSTQGTTNRRDGGQLNRSNRTENTKDLRETLDEKHAAQAAAAATSRREREGSGSNRNARNDSRGRRRTSRDRPNAEETRLPAPNSVMPPITTWSSEDMMIAEAFGKKSPPRADLEDDVNASNSNTTNAQSNRPVDGWQQALLSKPSYPERSIRNQEDVGHQQHYNSRSRYQDRGDDSQRPTQFASRNQYHNRSNQQNEWHRASNFGTYAKSNDYVVKTQTFENSRLSQGNQNRSSNRDLREVINERRGNHQQNFQNKVQHGIDHQTNHRGHAQGQYHQQYTPSHHYMHPHHQQMVRGQPHMLHQTHQHQAMASSHVHQPQGSPQPSPLQTQTSSNHNQQQQQNSHPQQPRQPPTTQSSQPVAGQSRQNIAINNVPDGSSEPARLNATSNSDSMNSRPIVKTDAYTGAGLAGHQQHSQSLSQHSQNHRSIGGGNGAGPMTQPGSHIVPTHIGAAGTQPQYYQTSSSSRDPSAAIASAYHGYIPSGHPVMDPSRYHMTSQQLSDHGYIAPGQSGDVAAGSVLHQQGLYTDTSGASAMANTAYLAQAGSSLSPTTNIPVTGAGSQPLAPVSYIQHSQYPPPPYSNPYPQPQMNQPPPQSGHGYPYWAYI